jgi:LPS-assembly protein
MRLYHTYKDAPNETKINFVSADVSHRLDRRYTIKGGIDYDIDNDFTKEWRLGLNMYKKCWSYELRYRESVTPSLTSGGTESIKTRGIYLFVRFAHIGGVEYKYIKDETNTQPYGSPSDLLPADAGLSGWQNRSMRSVQ